MRLIIYSSAKMFVSKKTGGMKRFLELTKYLHINYSDSYLVSQDERDTVKKNGIVNFIQLNQPKNESKLLPEVKILLNNSHIVKQIKKKVSMME